MSQREREPGYEFCICHLEDRGKDAEKFWSEINKIFEDSENEKIDFRGFFFVPQKGEPKFNFSDKTFSKKVYFRGATFSKHVDFSHVTFSDYTDFSSVIFCENVNFRNCKFSESANFNSVVFSGISDFRGCEFSKGANFSGTIFSGKSNFQNTVFSKKVYFRGATFFEKIYFHRAIFSRKAYFQDSVFFKLVYFRDTTFSKKISLHGALFLGGCNFRDATFLEDAYFKKTVFSKKASFNNNKFSKDAHFDGTEFGGDASFRDVEFGGDANFRRVTFSKNAVFSASVFKGKARFQRSNFHSCEFRGAEFKEVYFKDAVFVNELDFFGVFIESYGKFINTVFSSGANIGGCDFGEPVKISFNRVNLSKTSFKNTDLSKINFENCTWAKIDKGFISIQRILGEENRRFGLYDEFKLREEKKEGKKPISDDYSFIETLNRQLKYNYEEKRNYPDAGEFYISEMEMRRLNPDTPTSKKVILTPYKVLGLYGEAIARPIFWFTTLILFSTFEFHHIGDSNMIWVESFKTALRFAYLRPDFGTTKTFLEVLLGLFTSVIGVTLIALTVIGIKRQVRR